MTPALLLPRYARKAVALSDAVLKGDAFVWCDLRCVSSMSSGSGSHQKRTIGTMLPVNLTFVICLEKANPRAATTRRVVIRSDPRTLENRRNQRAIRRAASKTTKTQVIKR